MKKLLSILSILLVVIVVGFVGFTLFNSRNKANSPIDFSTLTYTALGDSITFGRYNSIKMEKPYPILVGEELGLSNVVNLGVSGLTLSKKGTWGSIITKTNDVPSYSDIISVMGGTNDFAQNMSLGTINDTSTDTVYGGLKNIAHTLKTKCPNAFIFFMTALPLGDSKLKQYLNRKTTIEEINIAIKNVADLYDIPVLDTYSLANFESEMNNKSISDGCHPSDEFHKNNLSPLIIKFIKDNYRKN